MFVIGHKITLKWVLSKVRSKQSAANRGCDDGRSSNSSWPHKTTNLR